MLPRLQPIVPYIELNLTENPKWDLFLSHHLGNWMMNGNMYCITFGVNYEAFLPAFSRMGIWIPKLKTVGKETKSFQELGRNLNTKISMGFVI
jgi:hypothetical protein